MRNDDIWNYMTNNEKEIQCCFCGRIFSCTIQPLDLMRHLTENHVKEKEKEDNNIRGSFKIELETERKKIPRL